MTRKDKRKPRKEYIYGTTAGEVDELEIGYNAETGAIRFGGEFINTYSAVSYDRSKGEKVLSRIPQTGDELYFDQPEALASAFDFLCAVDTNTRTINEKKVSVTGVVQLVPVWVPEVNGLTKYWRFQVPFCLEFVELATEKPENYGWLAALEQMYLRGMTQNARSIGMIVDSDLGNISCFNARRKPVDGTSLLPEGVKLIYASADAGKEHIVNQTISVADSVAAQCLEAVNSGKAPINTKRTGHPDFQGFRMILPGPDSV